MSNWCSTSFCINAKDPTVLKKIEDVMDYFRQNPIYKYTSGFGCAWLGNIIEFFGLPIEDKEFYTANRGVVTYYEYYNNQVCIDTETCYDVMPDAIVLLNLIGNIGIGYQAEEFSEDLFMNDGTIFTDEWMYDVEDEDYHYLTSEEMRKRLEELFQKEAIPYDKTKTLKELVKYYRDHTEREDFFNIHQFDAVDITEVASFTVDEAKQRIKEHPIPVYEIFYSSEEKEYHTILGVTEERRLREAIQKLRKEGFRISRIERSDAETAYELWNRTAAISDKAKTA